MFNIFARIVQELVVAGDVTVVIALEGQAAAITAQVDGVAGGEFGVVSTISAAHCNCECADL